MPSTIDVQIGLPSGRSLSIWIKSGQLVNVKMLTNEVLEGRLRWQDSDCLGLIDGADQTILIWRQAIAYIRPKS